MGWRGAQVGVRVSPDRLAPPKSALAPGEGITGVLEGTGVEGWLGPNKPCRRSMLLLAGTPGALTTGVVELVGAAGLGIIPINSEAFEEPPKVNTTHTLVCCEQAIKKQKSVLLIHQNKKGKTKWSLNSWNKKITTATKLVNHLFMYRFTVQDYIQEEAYSNTKGQAGYSPLGATAGSCWGNEEKSAKSLSLKRIITYSVIIFLQWRKQLDDQNKEWWEKKAC